MASQPTEQSLLRPGKEDDKTRTYFRTHTVALGIAAFFGLGIAAFLVVGGILTFLPRNSTKVMWSGKNGDAMRSGHSSAFSGPTSLAKAAWTYQYPGLPYLADDYESPLVDADGNVFVGEAVGTVLKLSANGAVLWRKDLGAGGLATPALDYSDAHGKLLLYITPLVGGRMLALDASSGAVVLNVTYGRGTTGQGDGWSVGAAAGVVVVSGLAADAPMVRGMVSTPSVFALNASTGAPVWGFSAFEGPASLSNGSYGPYNFLPIIVVDGKPRPSLAGSMTTTRQYVTPLCRRSQRPPPPRKRC